MSSFDQHVSQAVFATKLIERALHDSGPWTLCWGPLEVPVQRTVADESITFRAEFPDHCLLQRPTESLVVLRCRGEAVAVRPIEDPGDGAFVVEWTLRARITETLG